VNDDRELWAVLVALEPLDDRKWDYLDLTRRTFDAEGLLSQPWSSGERVLVEVAASLWNTGKVDLGYIASAMGGRHFQAIVDAVAVRAGQGFASHTGTAIRRVAGDTLPARDEPLRARTRPTIPGREWIPTVPGVDRGLTR
jgi:hypothetical protein